ncbi:uncharacterized protein LOC125682605 [Ostrea edulis]|uniref:uncharacterized protein LOC125682605 n=1 Tax=Ostrea edulis TaxID=37623 RepID=UPI0020959D1C|nr:uncharacterized protein LOC125682605 [Ostrea edulis]
MYSCVRVFVGLLAVSRLCCAYENLALNKSAEQSSTLPSQADAGPMRAVDNNTDQILSSSGTNCARTDVSSIVWWRVDLGEIRSIHDIRVYYRNDSDGYVQNRVLSNAGFSLYVSDTTCDGYTGGHLCYKNNDTLPQLESDHLCTRHARYVTYYNERGEGVILPPKADRTQSTTIAELCEVQVFGCTVGIYGENCDKECPINCRNKQCDIETGACLQCNDGLKGERCDQNLTILMTVFAPQQANPSSSSNTTYIAVAGGLFLALIFSVGTTITLALTLRKLKGRQANNSTDSPTTEQSGNYVSVIGIRDSGHQYAHLGVNRTDSQDWRDSNQYLRII